MNKIQRLKCCDWVLAISGLIALASGIYLEATDSRGIAPIWLHIVVCMIFMSLVHFSHSGLGGWHGKIGFVFMAIAIAHGIKRMRFFKPKTKA